MAIIKEDKKRAARKELTTAGVMAAMEFMDVGCTTLSKVAMRGGMNNFIFVVYTHALGSIIFIPLCFLFHRRVPPPPLSMSVFLRLLLLSFLCYFCSLFLFIGVGKSSPTLASAVVNLSPAFTFILAILFRMEALDLRVRSSLFKSAGTIVSITGAFVVIFYQGWPISLIPQKTSPPDQDPPLLLSVLSTAGEPNWILGGFFITTSAVLLSLILIVKTWILRDYPSEMLLGLITFSIETVIAAAVAIFTVQNSSDWLLGFNAELITIIFTALMIVVVLNSVHSWGCRIKGAVYVAMFKPLQMIIAVLLGVAFLGDTLHFGSVVGGTIIALGFYTVMKGKTMEVEQKVNDGEIGPLLPCDQHDMQEQQVPLMLKLNKV